MMGNPPLSFIWIFVIVFLIINYDKLLSSPSSEGKVRMKRDHQTDFGSFDLHFKTSSSRQSKQHVHVTSESYQGWNDNVQDHGRNEYGYEGVRGDQVQGLDEGGIGDEKWQGKGGKSEEGDTAALSQSSATSGTSRIWYLGCFSTWEKQFTSMLSGPKFSEDYTHVSCAETCFKEGLQVSFLRGSECQCTAPYMLNSHKIDLFNCYIPCPIRHYNPTHLPARIPEYPCGGNLGQSVYCREGKENNCSDLVDRYRRIQKEPPPKQPSQLNLLGLERSAKDVVLNEPCAVCKASANYIRCNRNYLLPDFDYFPTNSPKKCVDYCGRNVTYVARINEAERVREPTPFAGLTWWTRPNDNDGGPVDLPICRCITKEEREFFKTSEDSSICNEPCPGDSREICGAKENSMQQTFSSIFCVNEVEEDLCQAWNAETGTSPEATTTTTTPETTTTEFPDPCKLGNDDYDCEETEPDHTDHETSSTQTTTNRTTEEEVTTEFTTELISNTTIPSDLTTSTISTATTPRDPTFTTTTLKPECNLKCSDIDRHGHHWEVCAGHQGIVPCSKLITNSTGQAFWTCSSTGKFETPSPDVNNCSSSWVADQNEQIENIKDFNEAEVFMEKLLANATSAQTSDSTTRFFGHEIRSIVSFVDKTIIKAKEFTPELPMLEGMIGTAVDLTVFLIQYQEPWEDLETQEKSAVSTDLLDHMESTMFHLTNEIEDDVEYRRIFAVQDDNGTIEDGGLQVYKFLLLAETFDKLTSGIAKESYEFPPRSNRNLQDSFIKLPGDWSEAVTNDKVEIAAMSIDPEYISQIMPGQYDNLVSISNWEGNGDNSKLINGRMISLSLASAEHDALHYNVMDKNGISTSPRVIFKGKGAEITFHHDIEAWGASTQSVPRKLHDGENPRAVLGSTQCVYWDTTKHEWSSNGCKIIRSNRYETVCECNHLTSFAVLMDVHKYVGKQLGLELLTLILCPASEVALVLSIIILSSVNGLQRLRAIITTNLSACLLIGNALVLFVLDRNYFNMSETLCAGAAMITHYIFLCAFFWMLIEGVQLYRMVVHVFDSGRSYIKHFAILAYGTPLIIIATTATTGYLREDRPYGGDVYCWLEGPYIWSFMGPVALVIMVNLIILFIALKTAYQLQQTKKLSPTFLMGKIRSSKTWFKGCFSLTVILGLTWVVGFFTFMKSPSGIVAAYLFTILNASQGIFIFLFNCVLNDKVRSFTKRNLSTYLPSWITSSVSGSPEDNGNDASFYGKRRLSPGKVGNESVNNKLKKRATPQVITSNEPYIISRAKSLGGSEMAPTNDIPRVKPLQGQKVDFIETKNPYVVEVPVQRCGSTGTISSVDSIPASSASDNGHISSDASQNTLISKHRIKNI